MAGTHNVFVYGTLRRGQMRNPILRDATLVEETVTLNGYDLYDLGSFPGIVPREEEGSVLSNDVVGELYEVDEALLRYLDSIEGYRRDFEEDSLFLRRKVVVVNNDGDQYEAWAYEFHLLGAVRSRKLIKSGDYCARREFNG